ncbi:hypothetical protein M6B38_142245 [Iris pallida]|uniref:Uncharacterized protein n=1 Tax=Iris pallida TaxID=29817 RepID=A0AAX6FAV8_IRIPA|nr:hypothetical protein M6B38_142245 [Iris pallida]
MGFDCTSLITRKLRWRYGYEPLRLATVIFERHALRSLVPKWGLYQIPFTARAHATKGLFSLHIHFSMVRLPYWCLVTFFDCGMFYIQYLYGIFIVSCYVPRRTWLSRQVCALMISAGALAKAMTCALFFEMLLLDHHLLCSTKFLSLYISFLLKLVGSGIVSAQRLYT